MRNKFIALTAAVIMLVPGLTGRIFAWENSSRISAEEQKSGRTEVRAEDAKALEAGKAEEARKSETEQKAAEEAKKNIIARVNGAEINMFQLVRAMNRVAPKYVKGDEEASAENTAKIKKEALDRLIFEELAVQEAIRQGINPAPEAIDKVVAQVRENAGSEEAYREYLDKSSLTEDALKKLIERSQRYELITAREIYGKVKVDQKLVRDEYEKEKGRFILPENFVADDVFILQGKDEESARKKADEIMAIIRKNNNDVWKLVLDGTFVVKKTIIREDRHPELYKAVNRMKVGDLSSVIKDKDGFHIIKVTRREPSRQLTFEEAKSVIEPKFLVPAQEQRKEEWEKELKKDAKIEVLSEGTKSDAN